MILNQFPAIHKVAQQAVLSGICGFVILAFPQNSAATPVAVSKKPLAALVEHTTREITSSGVHKSVRFQEKIYRGENDVWIERVIPDVVEDHHEEPKVGHGGHKHLNRDLCARWISRLPDGSVRFRLVDTDHKTIIDVLPAEYSSVGFNGRWDMAYHLIAPSFLKTLTPTGSKSGGIQNYTRKDAQQNVVVIWDYSREMPTQMRFKDAKGIKEQAAVVSLGKLPAQLPWTKLADYKKAELSDFMD